MTLLGLTYDTRRGRFGRVRSGDSDLGRGARKDARDAAAAEQIVAMDIAREIKLQQLRERIAHEDYSIDPQAVADAIVARLLAGEHLEPHDERP